ASVTVHLDRDNLVRRSRAQNLPHRRTLIVSNCVLTQIPPRRPVLVPRVLRAGDGKCKVGQALPNVIAQVPVEKRERVQRSSGSSAQSCRARIRRAAGSEQAQRHPRAGVEAELILTRAALAIHSPPDDEIHRAFHPSSTLILTTSNGGV